MAKDKANRIPQLPSRILNSKRGPTPAARNTRGRTSQSSKPTNSRRMNSPAQSSAVTKSRKTTSAAKPKLTAKDKRQAALVAAEENAARLDACGYSEEDEDEEAEATNTQGETHRLFRAANLQDASDNEHEDDEDEDESPEASRRPRLSRGLSIEDDEIDDLNDREDEGMAGLDNDDSDSDDPANSPTHHGRRKDKIKFIPVGSTTITSKLPAKKPNKKPISARQASDQSSEGVRSPTRTGMGTASSSPRSIRGTTSSPTTPRKTVVNSSKPRMIDQTPASQGLLKAASSDTRQELAVKDAFPERVVFTERCKATFLAACDDAKAIAQRQRFLKSESYRARMLNILRQKLSQMRQEVRNAAIAKTAIYYGITSTMNPTEIVELVRRLKTDLAYVFVDPVHKKAPYGNPIFQILINALYFEGKRKSEAVSNPAPWNPMPLPVVALMATAIHSVLDDWSTGKNEAAKNQFSHDKYAPVYRDHLANLARFNEKAPAAVAKLRRSLWENAWESTGYALPDEGNVCIDDDVFAEAEAEALA